MLTDFKIDTIKEPEAINNKLVKISTLSFLEKRERIRNVDDKTIFENINSIPLFLPIEFSSYNSPVF